MSAPRVKVVVDATGDLPPFVWYCTAHHGGRTAGGEAYTIHDAATNGTKHLAAHHTAQMPPVAHGDPDCLNVPQNAIQRAYDTTRSTT